MIHILHIESSSKNCSVSLGTNGKLNSLCEEISLDFKHNEKLHTFVEWALEGAEIELKDLHAVSVGKGPGSYTGLRIGVASAKGFCFGNDIPLLSINSLYSLAFPFFHLEYDFIIPVMDARRMEVYTCVYDPTGNEVESTHPHVLTESSFEKYRDKKILFVGDAVEKTQSFFRNLDPDLQNFFTYELSYPSAKNMIEASFQKYNSKQWEDVAYFDPLYLKEWK